MMKLSSILKSRGNISGQLRGGAQDVFMGCARFSTVGQKPSTGDRIFAAYSIYKGKAALSAELSSPTFTKNDAGDLFIKRSGCIMLSFTPAIGERKYDWERKQRFAMSATEVGSLISLGPTGSCDFFHDPGMKSSNAGQVRKTLQIRANPDGTGYFFSLSVVDTSKKINERFAVPVTSGEFSVMRTSFSFALPHILGWDRCTNKVAPPVKPEYSKLGAKPFASEWDR